MCSVGKTGRDRLDRLPSPVRPVAATGQTGLSSHSISRQREVSTSSQPNSSSNFDKVLAEYKNDLSNLFRENCGVDVRSKTRAYQKSYHASFDSVHILVVLGCLNLLNLVGKILEVILSILVSILPN